MRLTPHQERVLDAMVEYLARTTGDLRLGRQDLVRDLIKDKYRHLIKYGGMTAIERREEGDEVHTEGQ
jgi:hypothetical protein